MRSGREAQRNRAYGASMSEVARHTRLQARAPQAAPRVPFLDLSLVHVPLKQPILGDIAALFDSSAFSNGPAVARFEAEFARYSGTLWCVGVASGLDALRLALIATGLRPGREVIVPANTFVATFEAVRQAGGIPVPVDVTERDYNLDVDAAAQAVRRRTHGILPVHLYGQMADMRRIHALAVRHHLRVVEDACQAHGAQRDGIHPGWRARAAAFSFYPGKNLGAIGDAGAVVTDDPRIADMVQALREHGQRTKYHHDLEGYTSRLDAVQAAVLSRKLPLLEGWNDQRRRIAEAYGQQLAGVGDLVLPPVAPDSRPVWHLYPVRTRRPEALAESLRARGVATGRHYPQPAHLSPAFAWLGYKRGAFPVTEALARELLSLPIFPGMTEGQVDVVVTAVRSHFQAR
jgi:dTDP-4-amino-4,6-dideoxygalactose transaminase